MERKRGHGPSEKGLEVPGVAISLPPPYARSGPDVLCLDRSDPDPGDDRRTGTLKSPRLLRDGKDPLACYDCGEHCGSFMVGNSVWKVAFPEYEDIKERLEQENPGEDNKSRAMRFVGLCIACLYRRLPWSFDIDDFTDAKMNDVIRAAYRAGLEASDR